MFRIVSFCLVLFCSFKIGAQNIKVESFTRLETDITARVNVIKDANDDECALIKMVTTDVDYNMDESLKRETRVGEIWFYVPQGTKRIVIRHQKLGKLVYPLPETLKAKTTYQIKLPSNVEIIVHEDAGGQYMVMSVQPSDASVYIDDILEATNGGNFSKMLRYGEHIYRVEHPLYETKSGTFTINNKKELIEVKLVPAYGYLSFTSTPANAEITVNGKVLGHTPFKSEALREGTYRVKTWLSSYSEDEREVAVVRGQTKEVAIPLAATFGYMEVNTISEQGADVYINGMKVGKTPYRSSKLSEGTYKVKVVQSMYSPQERDVHIVRGQTEKISFNLTATFAEVTICSDDPQAEIVINGEKKAFGSWKGRLSEGLYQLAAYKKSHRDGTRSVEIKSGMSQQIVIPAPTPIYGSLNINSAQVGAVIKIDGKEVGRAPDVIKNVLIGEREVEISKEGCAPFKQIVSVEEGEVKDLNVNLSQGKKILFYNYTNHSLFIDGKENGDKVDIELDLSYEKHILSIVQGTNKHMKDLVVTEDSPNCYNVRYRVFTVNDVPGMQSDAKELVLDGKRYRCGKCMNAVGDLRGFVLKNKAYIGIVDPESQYDDRITKLKTFDFNTNKWGELPPIPRTCASAEYSLVQGYPLIKSYNDIYIWKANAWMKITIPRNKEAEVSSYILTYKGECLLFYITEGYGFGRVYWKDVSSNTDRKLGEVTFTNEFKPKYSTLTIYNTDGKLNYECASFVNYYGRSWMNHRERCSIKLDFLPLKKNEELKGLILEPSSSKHSSGINNVSKGVVRGGLGSSISSLLRGDLENDNTMSSVSTFSASAIDWNDFPEKYYSKAKDWTYIIGNAAYVLVVRSTSTDIRESFKKWEPSFGYMKNYVAKGSKVTLSMDALYKYDFQLKIWSKCPHKSIPTKTGKIYTSNPSPERSSIPSFSASVNGKYLVIDSQYRFDTETNSWQ